MQETAMNGREHSSRTADLWSYRHERELGVDIGRGVNLVGFDVVAADGRVGCVDEATYNEGCSYIVVETESRPVGKQAVLPAGVISRIDLHGRTILVGATTDEIESAPEVVPGSLGVDAHLDSIGAHYS